MVIVAVLAKVKNRGEGFISALTSKLLRQLSLTDRQTSIEEDSEEFDKWSYFCWLPVSVCVCVHSSYLSQSVWKPCTYKIMHFVLIMLLCTAKDTDLK